MFSVNGMQSKHFRTRSPQRANCLLHNILGGRNRLYHLLHHFRRTRHACVFVYFRGRHLFSGMQAVVSVIFNRLHSKKWNKDINGDGKITLYDIIYYENAFSPASYIASTIGTKESYEAVDYVTRYGSTLPPKVRYFRDSYDFSWEGYRNYIVLDNIYFGYFENWQQGAW